jgi:DNA polymerase III delta prime subunit
MNKIIYDNSIHEKINKKMDRFIDINKIPNILLYGESGSGKKTILKRFIQKIYKDVPTSEKNDYIMNVNCTYGKGIKFIRDELKFFAKINVNSQLFKSIILVNAEKLTTDAQSALRRCIELFSKNTRFFIIATDKESILKPIISRFSIVYVPLPFINKKITNLHYMKKRNRKNVKKNQYIKSILTKKIKGNIFEMATKIYEKGYSALDIMNYLKNNSKESVEKYMNLVYYNKIIKDIRNEKLMILQILTKEIK